MKSYNLKELIQKATEARNHAYAPYSGYKVGAALLAKSGKIYTGANIENIIYRTTHAEKLALDNAVLAGERSFVALVIVTDDEALPFPCGQCLQDLTEFDAEGNLEITTVKLNKDLTVSKTKTSKLKDLLPARFVTKRLK